MKKLALLTIPVIILFLSCPTGDEFSDIEGINLLASNTRAFTGWNVEYDIDTSFDYLVASDAGSVTYTTTGLDDPSSTVYRLELVNLMSDGGFESGTTTGIVVDGGAATNPEGSIGAGVAPYDIGGNVYYFNLPAPEDHIDFDLNTYLLEYSSGGNYVLLLDLKSLTNTVAFEQWPGESGSVELWSLSIENTDGTLYKVPENFTEYVDSSFIYNASGYFTVGRTDGYSPTQKGYMDNLRVARSDTGAVLVFEVPYTDPTGSRVDLLSGYYKFSVKILNDPEISPAPNGLNRMPANGVTLSIKTLREGYNSATYYQTAESDGGWGTWTEISVTAESVQIDKPDETSEAVMSISVVPTRTLNGSQDYDAGSILISEPSLEFSSDGTFN